MSIKTTASDTRRYKDKITDISRPYDRKAASVTADWQGDTGSAYKSFYRNAERARSNLVSKYEKLAKELDDLEKSVKKAKEDEAKKSLAVR
jgi:uncharacterized protein YukE